MRIRTAVLLSLFALTACKKKAAVPRPEPMTVTPAQPAAPTDVPPAPAKAEAEPAPDPAPTGQPLNELTAGATFKIAEDMDAVVMNPEPVSDANWRFPSGSECSADAGGSVTIVGRDGDDTLARYRRTPMRVRTHAEQGENPDDIEAEGECPDGTVFFLKDGKSLGPRSETDARLEKARKLLQEASPDKAKPRR